MKQAKILVIRFSSFGDILATASVVQALSNRFPEAEIHWLTRSDFAGVASLAPRLTRVWQVPSGRKHKGLRARTQQWQNLRELVRELKGQNFTHVYDAHNTLRSNVISWGVRKFIGQKFVQKSQYRLRRFLLFRFRINRYPNPFTLQRALLEPLQNWGVSLEAPPAPVLRIENTLQASVRQKIRFADREKPVVVLAPSASYVLKRWPVDRWKALVELRTDCNFVLLGGTEDLFLREISAVAQMDYEESCAVVSLANVVISNDTGVMHAAEQLNKPCVALMGPAPFGVPCRKSTRILERDLVCRPCSKHGQGPCTNSTYQKCMVDITVKDVSLALGEIYPTLHL